MSPPIMRYDAITLTKEEQHLRVPVIARKRPAMAEHDWLARTPIIVKATPSFVFSVGMNFYPPTDLTP